MASLPEPVDIPLGEYPTFSPQLTFLPVMLYAITAEDLAKAGLAYTLFLREFRDLDSILLKSHLLEVSNSDLGPNPVSRPLLEFLLS